MQSGDFRQRNRRQFLGLTGVLASGLWLPASLRAQNGVAQPTTRIFVHGAMHGAWCWYKILPRLAAAGVPALAIDLPGRGRNPMAREQQTRENYVESIVQAVDAAPGKVVLIGHDVSGLLISLAAEARPEKVARLIYLAAYLPRNGETLISLVQSDAESLALKRLVFSRDRASVQLREDAVKEVLYADCDEADIALARLSLVPEATQPFGAAPALSEARFGKLAKSYIVCAQDRAVGPALQRAMSTAGKCDRVVSLDSGHSPFFSMPDRLVAAFLDSVG
jgi:pimeloyl-ACP methyl ester carboxylesterase